MNNDLNQFNAGGSHSQNPLGGIPMGADGKGTPNTVEQGETMKGDFVYSDRITLTKDMVGQFNLPKGLTGKTVAEATKILDKRFEGRNDKITNSTKTNMLNRIAQAQETIKAKQDELAAAKNANSTEVPDMMGGQIPAGAEEFAYGGKMNKLLLGGDSVNPNDNNSTGFLGYTAGQADDMNSNPSGGGDGFVSNYGTAIGATLGGIGTSLSANKKQGQFYSPEEAKFEQTHQQVGAVKDAVAGYLGPWGMLFRGIEKAGQGIGASVGGEAGAGITGAFSPDEAIMKNNQDPDSTTWEKIGGIFNPIGASINTSKNEKDRQAAKQAAYARSLNAQFSDDGSFAYGGKMNKYANGGRPKLNAITDSDSYQNLALSTDLANQYALDSYNAPLPTANTDVITSNNPTTPNGTFGKGALNWLGSNYGDVLRYAPVAANAYQLSQIRKPDYEKLARLTNRYNPSYVDEAALQNIQDQELNNVSNAIQNSGGSQGAVRNSLLAASLNKAKGLSDAYMNARQINAGQDAVAQNFNLGVDQANIGQSNLELDINDRNRANYDTQRSKFIGAIGTDVGEIGKEEVYKKLARESFGYKWDGTYWVKPDGTKVSDDQVKKEITLTTQSSKALGGYMMRKKC